MKLGKLFSRASTPLYLVTDYMQGKGVFLSLREAGEVAGQVGTVLNNHASGFFGAYALFYGMKIMQDLHARTEKHAAPVAAAFAMAALGTWEATHINNGFDWLDMGVYVGAICVGLGLEKRRGEPIYGVAEAERKTNKIGPVMFPESRYTFKK